MNLESGLHFEQAPDTQHYYGQMMADHLVHPDANTCRSTGAGRIFVIDEAGLWLEATTYRRFRTALIPPTRRLPASDSIEALALLKYPAYGRCEAVLTACLGVIVNIAVRVLVIPD